jgi:hypothetical protein
MRKQTSQISMQMKPPAGFEIWDRDSRNLMGEYDTEARALSIVAKAVVDHGRQYIDSMVLVRVGPRGGLKRVAAGQQLAQLALHWEQQRREDFAALDEIGDAFEKVSDEELERETTRALTEARSRTGRKAAGAQ